ncbi:hypothetical protein ACOTVS_10070 [Aliarcobacter butzleri]|uniref:hypothetical protein n=1 Tax=Aliarcobacter butzleri TaxID=28197 RepID=UPI00344BC922
MFSRLFVLGAIFYFFYFYLDITSLDQFQNFIFNKLEYIKEIILKVTEQINKNINK